MNYQHARKFCFTAATVGASMLVAPFASAAVDPAVSAGVTALEADAATLGGIVTGAVITIMLIVLGIRLLKKLFGRAV
jgi:hypothetical protein